MVFGFRQKYSCVFGCSFRCDFQFFLNWLSESRHRYKVQNFYRKPVISNSCVRGTGVRNKLLHHSDPGRPLGVQMKTVYYEEQSIPKRTEIKNLKATELTLGFSQKRQGLWLEYKNRTCWLQLRFCDILAIIWTGKYYFK